MLSYFTQGKKIGVGRPWRRGVGWIVFFLFVLVISSAWRAPTREAKTIGVAARPSPAGDAGPVAVTQRGQRAVGLGFLAADPVAVAVRTGDRIDVTGAFSAAQDGQPLARTVLNHVLVIAAVRRGDNVGLTLSLTPEEAQTLAFAAANARLSLALCPAGPDLSHPVSGVTFDDI